VCNNNNNNNNNNFEDSAEILDHLIEEGFKEDSPLFYTV